MNGGIWGNTWGMENSNPIRSYVVLFWDVKAQCETRWVTAAFTAEDAITQARITMRDELYQFRSVNPVDDPDRFRAQLRKDLADAAPPMGTQEVQRLRQENRALHNRIDGLIANEKQLTQTIRRMDAALPEADKKLAEQQARAHALEAQLRTVTAAITGQNLGTLDRQVEGAMHAAKHLRGVEEELDHALKNLAKVCVAINPGSDKDKGTWVEQAVVEADQLRQQAALAESMDKQLTRMNSRVSGTQNQVEQILGHLARVCKAIHPEGEMGGPSYVDDSVEEAERLRKVDKDRDAQHNEITENARRRADFRALEMCSDELEQARIQCSACLTVAEGNFSESEIKQGHQYWTPAYQAVLDLYRKFEAALDVVEQVEAGVSPIKVARFRNLHPKPGP